MSTGSEEFAQDVVTARAYKHVDHVILESIVRNVWRSRERSNWRGDGSGLLVFELELVSGRRVRELSGRNAYFVGELASSAA